MRTIIILVCGLFLTGVVQAQVGSSISADGSTPNNNAMLDVQSPATGDGKGILIPRVTVNQRTNANASLDGGLLDDSGNLRGGLAQGLIVYQTDGSQGLYFNTSQSSTPAWVYLGASTTNYLPLTGGTMSGALNMGAQIVSNVAYIDFSADSVSVGRDANGFSSGVAVGWLANGFSNGAAVGYLANGVLNGVVVGWSASGTNYGVAVGRVANGSGSGVALGYLANGYNYGAAVGREADGSANGAAMGYRANGAVTGVAVGVWANGYDNGVAVGNMATGSVYGAAVGRQANGYESGAAVGRNANGANSGAALGYLANGYFLGAAVGRNANGANSGAALGYWANGTNSGAAIGREANGSVSGAALGYLANGSTYGAAVGLAANGAISGVAMGDTADGTNFGAAVGASANGYNSGVALGYGADGYNYGVAVGRNANGAQTNVAIGAGANAQGGVQRIAIGNNVTNTLDDTVRIRGKLYLDGATGGIYTNVGGFGSSDWGLKAFTIDHPLDPENKILRHFCLEGPQVWNVYAGNVQLVNGQATVQLPDYYSALNRVGSEIYSLTPIGGAFPVGVKQKVQGNRFVIVAKQDGEVSWTIKVLRNDPGCLEDLRRRPVEQMKSEISNSRTAE